MPENPVIAFLLNVEDVEAIAGELGVDSEDACRLVLEHELDISNAVYIAMTEAVWKVIERNQND